MSGKKFELAYQLHSMSPCQNTYVCPNHPVHICRPLLTNMTILYYVIQI